MNMNPGLKEWVGLLNRVKETDDFDCFFSLCFCFSLVDSLDPLLDSVPINLSHIYSPSRRERWSTIRPIMTFGNMSMYNTSEGSIKCYLTVPVSYSNQFQS